MTLPESALARLARNPDDVDALLDFSKDAARGAKLDAALTAVERAQALRPADVRVLTQLGHVHHDRGEWFAAKYWYDQALAREPVNPVAHEGASYTALRLQLFDVAKYHRDQAFAGRALTIIPAASGAVRARVLLVVSAIGGNVDTRPFLTAPDLTVIKLVAEYIDQAGEIPPCDVVFHAVGDADRCSEALHALMKGRDLGAARMLNLPRHVARTTRAENAARLGGLEHVVTARTAALTRTAFANIEAVLKDARIEFPLIVRALGYHTGEHCERVENPARLRAAIERMPGDDFLVAQFLDVTDADGWIKKYRVMVIGGELYPVHLAASRAWKVHYVNSDTQAVSAHRAAEAEFLEDPRAALGNRTYGALRRIAQTLALDYAGIDFSLNAGGDVVCFEANATMVAPLPGADPRLAYRRAAIERIHAAVSRLIDGSRTAGDARAGGV